MEYRPNEGLPGPIQSTGIPVDAFNPLLRSLLSWELVSRVEYEDGSHSWELREDAQRKLDELNPTRRRAATSLAYLDHWCARCRQQRLTHLREGRYICEECEAIESGHTPVPSEQRHARAHNLHHLGRRREPGRG